MVTTHKHTVEELQAAVTASTSIRQVLMILGIAAKGGNYKTIQQRLMKHNIDTSHFLGMAQKGRPKRMRRDINDYLNNDFPVQSNMLRKRLLREGVLERRCSSCGLEEWMEAPIPLELDHIDGDHQNNLLSNLRLLCPNCHALTPTYRGKNKK